MKPQLRIHIAVLGYLADRVFVPAIDMKADSLYLLNLPNETNKKAITALKKIRSELAKAKIKLIEESCEIFKVTEVVKKVRGIILKESNHHLLLNISSGNTLSSNSLTIASMLYKDLGHSVQMYYVKYDYDNMQVSNSEAIGLPAFSIRMPDALQQKVLKYVSSEEQGVTRKQILKQLNPLFNSLSRIEKSKEIMNLNRQVIDKLCYDWKMINIEGKGKNSKICLNKNGEQFILFI